MGVQTVHSIEFWLGMAVAVQPQEHRIVIDDRRQQCGMDRCAHFPSSHYAKDCVQQSEAPYIVRQKATWLNLLQQKAEQQWNHAEHVTSKLSDVICLSQRFFEIQI